MTLPRVRKEPINPRRAVPHVKLAQLTHFHLWPACPFWIAFVTQDTLAQMVLRAMRAPQVNSRIRSEVLHARVVQLTPFPRRPAAWSQNVSVGHLRPIPMGSAALDTQDRSVGLVRHAQAGLSKIARAVLHAQLAQATHIHRWAVRAPRLANAMLGTQALTAVHAKRAM